MGEARRRQHAARAAGRPWPPPGMKVTASLGLDVTLALGAEHARAVEQARAEGFTPVPTLEQVFVAVLRRGLGLGPPGRRLIATPQEVAAEQAAPPSGKLLTDDLTRT